MPGPLSNAHVKYEDDCSKCHKVLDRKIQRTLCLACHKKVEEDINNKTGFHGKERTVSGSECHNCHTEHAGRDGEIILMDMDIFNHATSDFPLKLSHSQVKCGNCHQQGTKFRDAPSKCVSCHESQEPHTGQLGRDCSSCHQEDSWKKFRFDHGKTKFPLLGRHEKLTCNSCHPNQKWKNLSRECRACHAINDVHSGRFGGKCDKCHSANPAATEQPATGKQPSAWRSTNFDHKTTRYPLTGLHLTVTCMQCHNRIELPAEKNAEKYVSPPCLTCHTKSDEHKGTFGKKCESCHAPTGWKKAAFDHNRTKFPLKDKHLQVACTKCHTGSPLSGASGSNGCEACHRLDDKHKGNFGQKCATCHTPLQWKKAEFDHNTTKYPLRGKHATAQCAACHIRPLADGPPDHACENCHLKNDAHKGQEGKRCEKCHTPEGWRENIFFDHDLTEFPLLGLHTATPCESCHLSTTFKDTSKECNGCHASKDRHQRKLGDYCGTCHNPSGWKFWNFNHDTQSKFPLAGAHLGLDCLACHKDALTKTNKPPSTCFQCHKHNDKHRNKFGQFCQRCHTPDSFKNVTLQK